jgi:hypothetical protein
LGAWAVDYGATTCGNTIAVITITQALGQYFVSTVISPLQKWSPTTGTNYCTAVTLASISATYSGTVFSFISNPDSDTCPGKAATWTMTINSACAQASLRFVSGGCSSCDSKGMCSGCGTAEQSVTCTVTDEMTAVRSTQ